MTKKQKFWGFAALVAVVVGFAVYDFTSSQNQEKKKSEESLLIATPVDQIAEFSIAANGAETQVQKDKEGWKLLKPVQDAGDNKAIEQFVEGLTTEKYVEVAVEGDSVDFSAFGLDQPQGVITVKNNMGQSTQIAIGKLKNFQGDSFLRKNDEKRVLIASSTWFSKLEKKPTDFRDKRLMRLSNASVEKIQIAKGKSAFELVKKDSQWTIANRPDWNLDQNKVRELLAMLNATEALEFIAQGDLKAEEAKKWGLSRPRMVLTAELKDQKKWTAQFSVGADKVHRVHVSEPDQVLKISPTDSDKFFQMTEAYFRDHSEPFKFDRNLVQKIELKVGKQSKTVKKEDDLGSGLLSQIAKLQIFDFAENPKAKLDQEIVFKGEGDKEVFKLQWGHLHSVKVNGQNVSVYDAKTSAYPKSFKIAESDISDLKLNEEKSESKAEEKEKESVK